MSIESSITEAQITDAASQAGAQSVEDQMQVSALDLAFQDAVKRNDADQIGAILHPQFAMVFGDGRTVARDHVLDAARNRTIQYEIQDEDPGTRFVRVWGDTAVVTALLHIKGTRGGELIEKRVWFSDTYVRTGSGWLYAFAQVSLPLPID